MDDDEFIEQNCHNHAVKNKTKQAIEGDPHSWIAKSQMTDTNYGYVVFHYGSQSQVKDYKLKFDERYFSLYLGRTKLSTFCSTTEDRDSSRSIARRGSSMWWYMLGTFKTILQWTSTFSLLTRSNSSCRILRSFPSTDDLFINKSKYIVSKITHHQPYSS